MATNRVIFRSKKIKGQKRLSFKSNQGVKVVAFK